MMRSWSNRLSVIPLAALMVLGTLCVLGFLSSNSPAVAQGTFTAPASVIAVSNSAGELTLTWQGGDNADAFLLIAVHLETYDYETETVAGGVAKTGTVTGLTGGANYLGIVVALHTTAYGLQTAYGVAPPIPVQSSGTSAATDRAALIALYNATGGANWNDNTNWLTNAPLEQWYGVSRDGNGRVAGLDLYGNQLTGELPPELGNLTYLVTLDLGSNQLAGKIPSELGDLGNLVRLYLYSNDLTGEIPSNLGNLHRLNRLLLYGNQLTKEIPPELGNLSNLTHLYLGENQLTGNIPVELGNLAKLTALSLDFNKLTGTIPPALGNLSDLVYLYLDDNQLTGPIPPRLGNLPRLDTLLLSGNRLTGAIPRELGGFPTLGMLSLRGNLLTGEIPPQLGNLSDLVDLYLDANQLTGRIPWQLGNLSNLDSLRLDDNRLTGEIPAQLGDLTNLISLNLGQNRLTGTIPPALAKLANLQYLYLGQNQLTGEIPTALGALSNLMALFLDDNRLAGAIPSEMGLMVNLTHLFLGGNQLIGCIPIALEELQNNDFAALGLSFCGAGVPDLVAEPLRMFIGDNREIVGESSERIVAPGSLLRMIAGVTNQGTAPSGETDLRYYLSEDDVLSIDDTEIAALYLEAIAVSAYGSGTIGVEAPAAHGTYYYIACVDAVPHETDTLNNCSPAAKIVVMGQGPDLVVERMTTAGVLATPISSGSRIDGSVEAGRTFEIYVVVRNQGDTSAEGTAVSYFRNGAQVDTVEIGSVPASWDVEARFTETAPSTPGVYSYWACIQEVDREIDPNNNCSDTLTVEVIATDTGKPDLIVVSPKVSETRLTPGQSFTFSAVVRNQGDGPSETRPDLRYYVSTNHRISGDGNLLGRDSVRTLEPGKEDDESIDLIAPDAAGTYYYWACVDAVDGESNTGNNCSDTLTVEVIATETGKPDLIVVSPEVSETRLTPGQTFTFSAVVRNQGDGPSETRPDLRYYVSTNHRISGDGNPLGRDSVRTLEPGEEDDESIDLIAPDAAGTYYYWACVDAVDGESNTDNNCSRGREVDVVVPEPMRPDLIVNLPRVDNDRVQAGSSIRVIFTIENQGDGHSGPIEATAYLSDDRTITVHDEFVASVNIRDLEPSISLDWVRYNIIVPVVPGTHYYGACVDAVTGESNIHNNCSAGKAIVITAPDLVVEQISTDKSTLGPGDRFRLSAKLVNRGNGSSPSSVVRFLRSRDRTIMFSDTRLGKRDMPGLDPGGDDSDFSAILIAPQSAGTYIYGICADPAPAEYNTLNNCSDAVTITVVEPSPVEIQEETRCGWDFSFNPFNFGWRFKLEGTVTAIHTVDAVTVKGFVSFRNFDGRDYRESAGEQDLGRMSANDTEEFSITARDIAGFSQASIIKGCDYEFEWEP